jgi:hypothetical protein
MAENCKGNGGETPLDEHMYGGDEERVGEVVVVFGEHPFVYCGRER